MKYSRRWTGFMILLAVLVVLAVSAVLSVVIIRYRGTPYSVLDNYQNLNAFPVTIGSGTERSPPERRAVVSALYSDGFAIAAALLGHSARSANSVWPDGSHTPVPLIPPPHEGKDIHPRFMDQYTKLNIWNLDQKGIDSAVYLDADTLVRRNFDELFDSPFNFAAVPDVYAYKDPRGFSLSFNAGVLAFRPSTAIYEDMREKMEVADYPLLQAEQAFLNLYFGGTSMRLPYIYNANLAIKARSSVLWQRLTNEIRVVHYTVQKPFLHNARSADTLLTFEEMKEAMNQNESGYYQEEMAWWRAAYRSMMSEHRQAMLKCY
ncbi:Glycosyltransferase family 8 protein [Mycena venus]|uniref:Glycosyltransferase family 8 protein n=1 Tax=Mycena venus TaxID=2733690 RepID=A0A8H6Z4C2_9AGAR|nr:Glycosyltransferase family 8 protein [Mycena venus]